MKHAIGANSPGEDEAKLKTAAEDHMTLIGKSSDRVRPLPKPKGEVCQTSQGRINNLNPRQYPRESQETVFDAHERAFSFFKGACSRRIYDNMKTAVDAVLLGKERQFNGAFCGCARIIWSSRPLARRRRKKDQVENQVGLIRGRFFSPRLRVKSFEEVDARRQREESGPDGYFGSDSVAPWQDGGVANTTAISEGAILVEQPFS